MKLRTVRKRPDDLPRIRNVFLYGYACLAKLLAVLLSVLLSAACGLAVLFLLLLGRLVRSRRDSFRGAARRLVCACCRALVFLLRCIRFMRLDLAAGDAPRWKGLAASIVVANHPSILDLPLLLASVPNASFVVGRPGTLPLPLRFLEELFVTAPTWGGLCAGCGAVLSAGGSVVIFPERLLTPRGGTNPYRRTAARLARECGCGIQPLYIGGSDKYGLGSPAAPFAACRTGCYRYELTLLPPISGGEYAGIPAREASVAVTKKIHDEISAEAYLRDYRIV